MALKCRVLIADDHPIVLEGVRSLLRTDPRFEVVGEACTGHEVMQQVKAQRPDIVVLDLSMPHTDSTEIITVLTGQFPQLRIVVHTIHTSPQKLHQCLAAGIKGYVIKGDQHTSLLTAMASVAEGEFYLSPRICGTLIERYLQAVRALPVEQHFMEGLTTRECGIMRHTAQGLTTKEIAKRLSLSPKTVDNHLYRLKKKLNLGKKSDLVRYAVEHGLIHQDA